MARVYVGMSGGVDSSLSAALLVEQGYDVVGVYMKNWSQDLPGMACPWAEDLADAKRVAVQLGIPFKVFDFEAEYKHLVVDYMIGEYRAGRTPNPDVMCNQEVKFGIFLKAALADGADFIATGHYARIDQKNSPNAFSDTLVLSKRAEPGDIPILFSEEKSGDPVARSAPLASKSGEYLKKHLANFSLLRAKDENKDQTYFLYRITEEALGRTIFPIGGLTKPQVRAEAAKRGLITAGRRESQGICFVGSVGIREFLGQYVESAAGDVVEQESGAVVGRHDGAIFYTFGQRHGLAAGGGLPYYVVGKDMAKNVVFVSRDLNNRGFWREELRLGDVHWINPEQKIDVKKTYQVRLRHRGELIDCRLDCFGDKSPRNDAGVVVVKLSQPTRAVAPGQSAAIYDGEVVLGGGIVSTVD